MRERALLSQSLAGRLALLGTASTQTAGISPE